MHKPGSAQFALLGRDFTSGRPLHRGHCISHFSLTEIYSTSKGIGLRATDLSPVLKGSYDAIIIGIKDANPEKLEHRAAISALAEIRKLSEIPIICATSFQPVEELAATLFHVGAIPHNGLETDGGLGIAPPYKAGDKSRPSIYGSLRNASFGLTASEIADRFVPDRDGHRYILDTAGKTLFVDGVSVKLVKQECNFLSGAAQHKWIGSDFLHKIISKKSRPKLMVTIACKIGRKLEDAGIANFTPFESLWGIGFRFNPDVKILGAPMKNHAPLHPEAFKASLPPKIIEGEAARL